jgi:alpha-glucosidase
VVSYLNSGDQLHLAHNFVFLQLPWSAEAFRTSIDDFEAVVASAAWPAWFLSNHDNARVASRYGDDHGTARARAVLLMLYTLRGTPFIYQGEELGLPDAEVPPERVVDVDGRDPERAPIPWRAPSVAGPGAGFSTGEPWLPLVADAERLCVERQAGDPDSTLSLARRLAALRAATPALQTGEQRSLEAGADVLAWIRESDDDRVLTAINFAPFPVALNLAGRARVMLSTDPDRGSDELELGHLTLVGNEGVLLRLAA